MTDYISVVARDCCVQIPQVMQRRDFDSLVAMIGCVVTPETSKECDCYFS